MENKSGSFKAADGLNIFTRSWLPDGDVRAVVLIVHGLAEHMGRYAHVAAKLNANGYAVYGLDHRGHGKSDGLRAYFDNFDQPVNALKQYFDTVKTEQPGKKIFIYGHSLGSLISLVFLLRYQNEVAGAIISGTTLGVEAGQPALLISLGDLLNNVAPKLPVTPLDSKWLSHDPALVIAYDTDPLVHRGNVRVRMSSQIVHNSRDVRVRLPELKLPILILHGGDDKICPPSGSTMLNQGLGLSDKSLKLYTGMYHEVHNEVEKEMVLNDIVEWLNGHV